MKPMLGWRAAAATFAAAAALPAAACGFDGLMADVTPAHPQSIEVALAVRDAFDRNELAVLAQMPGPLGLLRANGMLQGFTPMVSAVAGGTSASVAVVLVESGLWTRYSFEDGQVAIWPHVEGPLPGEPVIVTSEAALDAVVRGTLAPARARELRVLVIDPGNQR
jgi:hypothetical protein